MPSPPSGFGERLKSRGRPADLFCVSSPSEIAAPYGSASLMALVRDFDRDAATHRRLIREILQTQRESFYAAAIEILKGDTDSRAVQFLVALLVSANLLFRAL